MQNPFIISNDGFEKELKRESIQFSLESQRAIAEERKKGKQITKVGENLTLELKMYQLNI